MISFCPATHPAVPFSEDHHLHIHSYQDPKTAVLEQTSPQQFKRYNGLLHTSIPTSIDAVRDIIPKDNGFVHTVLEAYNDHRALILRPDDVWTAILIQFSFFVNAHVEQLRAQFVAHDGKKELVVTQRANRYTANFALMARQMTELMHEHVVDPTLRDWIIPEFSTTTDVDRTVYAMTMMGTMKGYFSFKFTLSCGIPRVTLEGEKHDWDAILTRLDRLKQYGAETTAWYRLLLPIISRFVASFDAPDSPENLDFWNRVAHYESGGSGPTYLSGWITAFCVFCEKGSWQGPSLNVDDVQNKSPREPLFHSMRRPEHPVLTLDGVEYAIIDSKDVPCGYSHLDAKLDDNGELLDTVIVAGAVGAQICSDDKSDGMRDTVRPIVGYWWFIV
ncbi:hypothetical protein AZE42_11386 [Rhizopogon vesiculosus]|uniref:Uncharacterized protein n=1 Tax=Rhizopogon vesiculosus TaxID=180088 RepID=A0A1J8QWQ2_9AGAM|nr:hypothetical protein AZE42_11386 [Rhizopogon vesiculosus]